MANTKITPHVLDSTLISGHSTVTAATNDFVLIQDVSDSNALKKALVSDLAQNEESPTFTGNVTVENNLSSDTTSTPDTVLTLSTKYASTGTNGAAGAGTRLEFKIPDDETNPITGVAIAGIKEVADDSDASAGMAFYVSQNDTTLDEAVRIDHDGKVGIGTTSPDYPVEIEAGNISTGLPQFTVKGKDNDLTGIGLVAYGSNGSHRNWGIAANQSVAGALNIGYTANATDAPSTGNITSALLIDSSGNVGIGTTAPKHPLHVYLTDGELAMFGSNQMNSVGEYAGIGLGQVLANNTTYQKVAIVAEGRDSGSYVSNLHFLVDTAADGNSAVLSDSKMMIDGGNGAVGIGTTSPDSHVTIDGGSDVRGELNIRSQSTGTTYNGGTIRFKGYHANPSDGSRVWFEIRGIKENNVGGSVTGRIEMYLNPGNNTMTEVFKIESNGDTYTNDGTVHSLASDSRVKSDVADLTDGLTILNQLRPVTYKYNTKSEFYNPIDETTTRYGFVADEVKTVAPQYIKEGEGKVDGVEVDDFKTLSQTKMIPMLVKSIQELSAELDAAKARITTLEG